jgi:hypothetical protein
VIPSKSPQFKSQKAFSLCVIGFILDFGNKTSSLRQVIRRDLYLLALFQSYLALGPKTTNWSSSNINCATSHHPRVIVLSVIMQSAPYRPCENISNGISKSITIYVLKVYWFFIIDTRSMKRKPSVAISHHTSSQK